ncbi:MAG: lysophospholipase [Siphonobacter aquaeclarae]|nr:lysophospholipase [Siphonobacter aquaeclarae]
MTPTTTTFTSGDNSKIFYQHWEAGGEAKAVLVIVHGLNSHSGYYDGFAQQVIGAGIEVYALDLPGRGRSEGERYYIEDYHAVIEDISQLVAIARGAYPALPLFLLGHSAGGVFASVFAALHPDKLNGLISESFAFQVPAPDAALATLKFLSHIIPHTRVVRLNNEDFSRDEAVVEAMNTDPLLKDEKQPTKTMQQLILAAGFLKEEMPQMNLPVLILHGTADKATRPEGSQYFFDHISSPDKTLKLYEGHYHDLLNDLGKETVVSDILQWINGRV